MEDRMRENQELVCNSQERKYAWSLASDCMISITSEVGQLKSHEIKDKHTENLASFEI